MRLTELHPRWVGAGGEHVTRDGQPVPERHGVAVSFDCPCGCDTRCVIEFNNPLDGQGPHDNSRDLWDRTGDNFDTLTLTPSIQRMSGCRWHGFVTNGEVVKA